MDAPDRVPDAPVYSATLEEMDDLSVLLAKVSHLAIRYGAVRIDPPDDWGCPEIRLRDFSKFFVRMQNIPEAPFVDPALCGPAERPTTKRARARRVVNDDDDDDDDDDSNKQTGVSAKSPEFAYPLQCPANSSNPLHKVQDGHGLPDSGVKCDILSNNIHENTKRPTDDVNNSRNITVPICEITPLQTRNDTQQSVLNESKQRLRMEMSFGNSIDAEMERSNECKTTLPPGNPGMVIPRLVTQREDQHPANIPVGVGRENARSTSVSAPNEGIRQASSMTKSPSPDSLMGATVSPYSQMVNPSCTPRESYQNVPSKPMKSTGLRSAPVEEAARLNVLPPGGPVTTMPPPPVVPSNISPHAGQGDYSSSTKQVMDIANLCNSKSIPSVERSKINTLASASPVPTTCPIQSKSIPVSMAMHSGQLPCTSDPLQTVSTSAHCSQAAAIPSSSGCVNNIRGLTSHKNPVLLPGSKPSLGFHSSPKHRADVDPDSTMSVSQTETEAQVKPPAKYAASIIEELLETIFKNSCPENVKKDDQLMVPNLKHPYPPSLSDMPVDSPDSQATRVDSRVSYKPSIHGSNNQEKAQIDSKGIASQQRIGSHLQVAMRLPSNTSDMCFSAEKSVGCEPSREMFPQQTGKFGGTHDEKTISKLTTIQSGPSPRLKSGKDGSDVGQLSNWRIKKVLLRSKRVDDPSVINQVSMKPNSSLKAPRPAIRSVPLPVAAKPGERLSFARPRSSNRRSMGVETRKPLQNDQKTQVPYPETREASKNFLPKQGGANLPPDASTAQVFGNGLTSFPSTSYSVSVGGGIGRTPRQVNLLPSGDQSYESLNATREIRNVSGLTKVPQLPNAPQLEIRQDVPAVGPPAHSVPAHRIDSNRLEGKHCSTDTSRGSQITPANVGSFPTTTPTCQGLLKSHASLAQAREYAGPRSENNSQSFMKNTEMLCQDKVPVNACNDLLNLSFADRSGDTNVEARLAQDISAKQSKFSSAVASPNLRDESLCKINNKFLCAQATHTSSQVIQSSQGRGNCNDHLGVNQEYPSMVLSIQKPADMESENIVSNLPGHGLDMNSNYSKSNIADVVSKDNNLRSNRQHIGTPAAGRVTKGHGDRSHPETTDMKECCKDSSIRKSCTESDLRDGTSEKDLQGPNTSSSELKKKGDDDEIKEICVVRSSSKRGRRTKAEATKMVNPTSQRRAEKQQNKRKVKHIDYAYAQDSQGRLTRPVNFPDSSRPLTLNLYKKDAESLFSKMRDELPDKVQYVGKNTLNGSETDEELRQRVDNLEDAFWTLMRFGLNGEKIEVAYGVDVEAEGAFDSGEMRYVQGSDRGTLNHGNVAEKQKKGKKEGSDMDKDHRKLKEESEEEILEEGREGELELEKSGNNKSNIGTNHPRRPTSHVGNLNRLGLLRHLPLMPGINHPMFYVGQLFSRFCWHVEDAFLNSVSFLHKGSREKVWYAIPPSFATTFEKYAKDNVFAPELVDNEVSGQLLLMNKTTIFDPRTVIKYGIEVYRVIHKEGSFVLTAPRAYHAGFNCGYNIAEAVNYANPPWLSVGREATRSGRILKKSLCVPWEFLLFHEAKSLCKRYSQGLPQNVSDRGRATVNIRVVADELRNIINLGENLIRAYATNSNCRVVLLNDVKDLVSHKQLGVEFGHGAGMACSDCLYASHFYAEVCACCAESIQSHCMYHFGSKSKLCKSAGHRTIVVRRHDPIMLIDMLDQLEDLDGHTSSMQERYRRMKQFVRPWETPMQKTSGLHIKLSLTEALNQSQAPVEQNEPLVVEPKTRGNKKRRSSDDGNRNRDTAGTKRKVVDSDLEVVSSRIGAAKRTRRGNPGRTKSETTLLKGTG